MSIYFRTDGIRGVYGQDLTPSLANKCGNALARLCKNKKVVMGRDTRTSGDLIALSFASGLIRGGINVIDVGVTSTPAIAFLTKTLGFDYGVVISASHNSEEYNGIKIFDKSGLKICDKEENDIERTLFSPYECKFDELGKYSFTPSLIKKYKQSLLQTTQSLEGLKILLDCANGSTYKLAKGIFSKLGCKVTYKNAKGEGTHINKDCGATHPAFLQKEVILAHADMGFAFDGDGDRIIACNEKGTILDGDDILYILATHNLDCKGVVCTIVSNKGLENALAKRKIPVGKCDVGNKNVALLMQKNGFLLGGEGSGHIINGKLSTTGDGILTALSIASIVKSSGNPLSTLARYKKFPQVNLNIEVGDKYAILKNTKLKQEIEDISQAMGSNGEVIVRASGTENKIRLTIQNNQKSTALSLASRLEKTVLEIDKTK